MTHNSKESFKALFKEHYNVLCNYAFSFLNNHQLAEDAVQDVFLKIWTKKESIDLDQNIRSYLFSAVKNKSLEIIRKHKHEIQKIHNMPTKEVKIDSLVQPSVIDNYLLKERLNKSIRQLPAKCQDIFVLSKIEGLTYDEIAELRNISKKTVENHISKALKILRKTLR